MQDYAAAFTNFSGAYPDILAINASGPSTTDGTEFNANMINDSFWGVWQMLLNLAGMTPNGVLESDSASQIKEAMRKTNIPPGIEVGWHQAADPATAGYRLLLLSGQGVLRANYPDLDTACYVGDGNNAAVAAAGGGYFRADNSDGSSPSTTGVYLILPETRGYVPRGLDTAASVDPDGASRYLGDNQLDALQGHAHEMPNSAGVVSSPQGWDGGLGEYTTPEVIAIITDGVNGTPRTDTETRMVNYADVMAVGY